MSCHSQGRPMNSTVSPPFNESNSLRIRPVDGMRETKRASSPSNQHARTVLMRLPPVRLSVERGQTGGIFTLPICGHTPMPPFRGSNAFQERLFVVTMFSYSLSSLRVPCGRPNTFSRFVGSRLVAQPLIAVVRFCWALVKAS